MQLSERQKKFLRGKAHALKPAILIGKAGLTPGVIAETQRALADHELIKARVQGADRAARAVLLADLVGQTACALVTRIGHVAVLYKPRATPPQMVLPEA